MSVEIDLFDQFPEDIFVYNHLDPDMLAEAGYMTVDEATQAIDTLYFLAQGPGVDASIARHVIKAVGIRQACAADSYFATGEDYSVDNETTRLGPMRSSDLPKATTDIHESLALIDYSLFAIEVAIEDAKTGLTSEDA